MLLTEYSFCGILPSWTGGAANGREITHQFEGWWDGLTEEGQSTVNAVVEMLQQHGSILPRPFSDVIVTSRHANMKELRAKYQGALYRVLYAFDPRRCAILLLGGDKSGDPTWYDRHVPMADAMYDEHLASLKREGLIP
jgi:hypothetical protein